MKSNINTKENPFLTGKTKSSNTTPTKPSFKKYHEDNGSIQHNNRLEQNACNNCSVSVSIKKTYVSVT